MAPQYGVDSSHRALRLRAWPHTIRPTIVKEQRPLAGVADRITRNAQGIVRKCGRHQRSFVDRQAGHYSMLQKGGDPAAGSPTATLLRLRPSHCARLRPLDPLRVSTRTSGAHSFHGVTGGVYKARERIHRGVADPRLLAIPASCRRVADDNPN